MRKLSRGGCSLGVIRRHTGDMCRSFQTLRPPFHEDPTSEEIRAAALQYVRKVSGFRAPAPHNADAFNAAVDDISAATERMLDSLVVRGAPAHA